MTNQIWMILIVQVFLLLPIVYGGPSTCTKDFCKDKKCGNSSACDYKIPKGSECQCCDICVKYLNEGTRCVPPVYDAGLKIQRNDCGPFLICDPSSHKCVQRKDTVCLKKLSDYNRENEEEGVQHIGAVEPSCNAFGTFNPVQCRPGSMCYCVTANDGKRIFGQTDMKLQGKTKCECSRDFEIQAKLLNVDKSNRTEFQGRFLLCLENGDYDQLQCIDGKCFCINGTLHQIGQVVEEKDKGKLPCYNLHIHDPALHALCYKELRKLKQRKEQLEEMGNIVVGMELPSCDIDGSYSPKQCRDNHCFCVDKENKPIEIDDKVYKVERYPEKVSKNMKCNCAREQEFQLKAGRSINVECDKMGNYNKIQCFGSLCYCVDENGIQFGKEFDISQLDDATAEDKDMCDQ